MHSYLIINLKSIIMKKKILISLVFITFFALKGICGPYWTFVNIELHHSIDHLTYHKDDINVKVTGYILGEGYSGWTDYGTAQWTDQYVYGTAKVTLNINGKNYLGYASFTKTPGESICRFVTVVVGSSSPVPNELTKK